MKINITRQQKPKDSSFFRVLYDDSIGVMVEKTSTQACLVVLDSTSKCKMRWFDFSDLEQLQIGTTLEVVL